MACPIITGKGYTFSDPVMHTGDVGSAVQTTVEFTITPQEGFFLRADLFFVNEVIDALSGIDFIQDGNNVLVRAHVDLEMWPQDGDICIDVEYNYPFVDTTGLDPIQRIKTFTVFPVGQLGTTTTLGGLPIPVEGVEVSVTGVCGEEVALPELVVILDEGLELAEGAEDINVDEDGGADITPEEGTGDGAYDIGGTYTFDENDVQDTPDANPTPGEVRTSIPIEDIVDEDLLDPTLEGPSAIGLNIVHTEERVLLTGGPQTVEFFGNPGASVEYCVISCDEDPFKNTVVVPGLDSDGCPTDIETEEDVCGTIVLDDQGYGSFTFILKDRTALGTCCDYTIDAMDTTNSIDATSTIVQCEEVNVNICYIDLAGVQHNIHTLSGNPGDEVEYIGVTDITLTGISSNFNINTDLADNACWEEDPDTVFGCPVVTATLTGADLNLDLSFKDGTIPSEDVDICLDLQLCIDNPADPEFTVTYCIDVTGDNFTHSGIQLQTGPTGDALSTTPGQFIITAADGYDFQGTPTPTVIISQDPGTVNFTNGTPTTSQTGEKEITITYTPEGTFPSENVKVTYSLTITPRETPPAVPEEIIFTPGCTDPMATNYDPLADMDDGSCQYPAPPPTPEFTTTVKIVNNVPNTTLIDPADRVFGPQIEGTPYDGTYTLQSDAGYEMNVGSVSPSDDPAGILSGLAYDTFDGEQQGGDREVTITLIGVGPVRIPDPTFDCSIAQFTATVDDDGNVTGSVVEGTLVSITPETVALDSGDNTITAEITIPTGYENAGMSLAMGCTATVTAPETPPVPVPDAPSTNGLSTLFTVTSDVPGITITGGENFRNVGGTYIGTSPFGPSPFGISDRDINGHGADFWHFYNILGKQVGQNGQNINTWSGGIYFGPHVILNYPSNNALTPGQYYAPGVIFEALGISTIQCTPMTTGLNFNYSVQPNTFIRVDDNGDGTYSTQVTLSRLLDASGTEQSFATLRNTAISDYLVYGLNEWTIEVRSDAPTIPTCIRAYDLNGNNIDPRQYINIYSAESIALLDDSSLTKDQFLIHDISVGGSNLNATQEYFIDEGTNLEFNIHVTMNPDNFLTNPLAGVVAAISMKDQDENVINSQQDSLALRYFDQDLTLALTDGGLNDVQNLRYRGANTEGITKAYLDITIDLDKFPPIPKPASIRFNFVKDPDSPFSPINIDLEEDLQQSTVLSGQTSMPIPEGDTDVFYGILADEPTHYQAGQWQSLFQGVQDEQYWTDLGYTLNPSSINNFNLLQNTKIEFVSYTTDAGDVVTDDPYPNIGRGVVIDDDAMTIDGVTSQYLFRNYPSNGTFLTPSDQDRNKLRLCGNENHYTRLIGETILGSFDPRGGEAVYNVSIVPVLSPETPEYGTKLYTDESPDWMGTTVDNTHLNLAEYDWMTQEIGSPLSEVEFTITTERGFEALTQAKADELVYSIVERGYTDACRGQIDGPQPARTYGPEDMSLDYLHVSRPSIYGDRGSILVKIAGLADVNDVTNDLDKQLNGRDVILDFNMQGTVDPLPPCTFEVTLVDNMNNATVTMPATYSGFATEIYPENTPFLVAALPTNGYAFDSSSVDAVTITAKDGDNDGIFGAIGSETGVDFSFVNGELIVNLQPDTATALVEGHTTVELTATHSTRDITLGPPWETETDIWSGVANWQMITDDEPNNVLNDMNVGDVYSETIVEFNTVDHNSENNLIYNIKITPTDGLTFNGVNLDIGVFADAAGTTAFPSSDYIITNLGLDADGRSIVFDWEFSLSQVPDPTTLDIYLDVPEAASDDFVQVQFNVSESVDNAGLINGPTLTDLQGGLGVGSTATFTFNLKPDRFWGFNNIPSNLDSFIEQIDITTDSPATITAQTVFTVGQLGRTIQFTVSYFVSTDDFSQIIALSDKIHDINIVIDGSQVTPDPVPASVTWRVAEHADSTLTDGGDVVIDVDSGTALANTLLPPKWTLPTPSLLGEGIHWYRDGEPIVNGLKVRHISGDDFITNPTLTSTPTAGDKVAGHYKIMEGSYASGAGDIIPEGDHVYELYLDATPASDVITSITLSKSPVSADGETIQVTIQNETGSRLENSVEGLEVQLLPPFDDSGLVGGLPNQAQPSGDSDTADIVFNATNVIDEDDVLEYTIRVDTNFQSQSQVNVTQSARDRINPDAELTTLMITYRIPDGIPNALIYTNMRDSRPTPDDPTIPAYWNEVDLDSRGSITEMRHYHRNYPGKLSDGSTSQDNDIFVSGIPSNLFIYPESNLFRFEPQPEDAGQITYTPVGGTTNINGRYRVPIPNTGKRFPLGGDRGRLYQQGLDGLIGGMQAQNSHRYDRHPTADASLFIDVAGTGPTSSEGEYACNTVYSFDYEQEVNDLNAAYFSVDASDLFDGNSVIPGSLFKTKTALNVWDRQHYRVQLMYGDVTDPSKMGVFTDSGFIGYTQIPLTGIYDALGANQVYAVTGAYGFYLYDTSDHTDNDSAIPGGGQMVTRYNDVDLGRTNFDPSIMSETNTNLYGTYPQRDVFLQIITRNPDVVVERPRVAFFEDPADTNGWAVEHSFNLEKAAQWYNSVAPGEPLPKFAILRVLYGHSGRPGIDTPREAKIRFSTCDFGLTGGVEAPDDGTTDISTPLERDGSLWTLNRDNPALSVPIDQAGDPNLEPGQNPDGPTEEEDILAGELSLFMEPIDGGSKPTIRQGFGPQATVGTDWNVWEKVLDQSDPASVLSPGATNVHEIIVRPGGVYRVHFENLYYQDLSVIHPIAGRDGGGILVETEGSGHVSLDGANNAKDFGSTVYGSVVITIPDTTDLVIDNINFDIPALEPLGQGGSIAYEEPRLRILKPEDNS